MQTGLRKLYFYFTILIGYGEVIPARDQGTAVERHPDALLQHDTPLRQSHHRLAELLSLERLPAGGVRRLAGLDAFEEVLDLTVEAAAF